MDCFIEKTATYISELAVKIINVLYDLCKKAIRIVMLNHGCLCDVSVINLCRI